MAGIEAQPGGTDSTTIDVSDDENVHAWARKLDATPEQIREAVEASGNQAADVENALEGQPRDDQRRPGGARGSDEGRALSRWRGLWMRLARGRERGHAQWP